MDWFLYDEDLRHKRVNDININDFKKSLSQTKPYIEWIQKIVISLLQSPCLAKKYIILKALKIQNYMICLFLFYIYAYMNN